MASDPTYDLFDEMSEVTGELATKYLIAVNECTLEGIHWSIPEVNDGQRMLDVSIQIPAFFDEAYGEFVGSIIDADARYDLIEGNGDDFKKGTVIGFNRSRRTMTLRGPGGHVNIDIRLVHLLASLDYIDRLVSDISFKITELADKTPGVCRELRANVSPLPLIDIIDEDLEEPQAPYLDPSLTKITDLIPEFLEVFAKTIKTPWKWSVVGKGYLDDIYTGVSIKNPRRIVEFDIPADYGNGTLGVLYNETEGTYNPYVRGVLRSGVTIDILSTRPGLAFLSITKNRRSVVINLTILEIVGMLDYLEDEVRKISDEFAI